MIDPATFGNTIDGVPILITCEFEGTGEKIPWDGTSDTIAVALQAVQLTGSLTVGATITPNPLFLTSGGELQDDGERPVTELILECNVTNQDSSHTLNSLKMAVSQNQLANTGLFSAPTMLGRELLSGTDELMSGHRLSKGGRVPLTNPSGAVLGTHLIDVVFKGTSDDAAGTIDEIAHVDLVIQAGGGGRRPVPGQPSPTEVHPVFTTRRGSRALQVFKVKFKIQNDTDDDVTLSEISFGAHKVGLQRGGPDFGVDRQESIGVSMENVVVPAHSTSSEEFEYKITLDREPGRNEKFDLSAIVRTRP